MSEDNVQEDWEKWVPVADTLVLQAYYRVLSFVSFHAPIQLAVKAAKKIAETKRGGIIYEIIPDRVYRWDGIQVYPGITMNLWIFGSPLRARNTVYARVGFWTMELFRARAKRYL